MSELFRPHFGQFWAAKALGSIRLAACAEALEIKRLKLKISIPLVLTRLPQEVAGFKRSAHSTGLVLKLVSHVKKYNEKGEACPSNYSGLLRIKPFHIYFVLLGKKRFSDNIATKIGVRKGRKD